MWGVCVCVCVWGGGVLSGGMLLLSSAGTITCLLSLHTQNLGSYSDLILVSFYSTVFFWSSNFSFDNHP